MGGRHPDPSPRGGGGGTLKTQASSYSTWGFRVQGFVLGLGFWVLGFRGLGFRGLGVLGLGFGV